MSDQPQWGHGQSSGLPGGGSRRPTNRAERDGGSVTPIIVGLVLSALAIALVAFFLTRDADPSGTAPPVDTPTATATGEPTAQETPTESVSPAPEPVSPEPSIPATSEPASQEPASQEPTGEEPADLTSAQLPSEIGDLTLVEDTGQIFYSRNYGPDGVDGVGLNQVYASLGMEQWIGAFTEADGAPEEILNGQGVCGTPDGEPTCVVFSERFGDIFVTVASNADMADVRSVAEAIAPAVN